MSRLPEEEIRRRMAAMKVTETAKLANGEVLSRYIFPTETSEDKHCFAYTIGMCLKGQPELLAVGGLGSNAAGYFLHEVMRLWKEKGQVVLGRFDNFFTFGEHGEISAPVELVLVDTAHAASKYTIQVEGMTGQKDYSVVQIIWPDMKGKLPGEEGYDSEQFPQPRLPTKVTFG